MPDPIRMVVFSDCHGRTDRFIEALQQETFDELICLGDVTGDAYQVAAVFQKPVTVVAGNCDSSNDHAPNEVIVERMGWRLLCTHGHLYQVKSTLMRLMYALQEKGCYMALFGHTHHALDEVVDGLRLFNPGSADFPDDPYVAPSYGVVELGDQGLKAQHVFFDHPIATKK